MLYLSVQPDILYFHWQVELYIFNFIEIGIDPNDIGVIFLYNGESPSKELMNMKERNKGVNFFIYKDDRKDNSYIPSIKPYGMWKYFLENPSSATIFYHDCDIIFTKKLDVSKFEVDDIWYMSDTIGYIGYNYCISKGESQFLDMCKVIGIDPDVIKENQMNSGGAQYIMKNLTSDYWYKVYNDSNSLYQLLDSYPINVGSDSNYPIQKWCAEMWSTLWNSWKFGYVTSVHSDLDFCFATNHISDLDSMSIYHNAGVTVDRKDLFFKGNYISRVPYFDNFDYVDEKFCSIKYVENIEDYIKKLEN